MNNYQRCVDLCMKYFDSHQDLEGRFEMPHQDLVAYYKPVLAMTVAGRFTEAARTLNFVERTFMTEDGDFVTEPGLKSHIPHFHKHFYHYIHGWLIQSFCLNGRLDLARRAIEYLRPRQHDGGGFFSQKIEDPSKPGDVVDIGSTCSCGFGLLTAGHVEEARSAGQFLIKALQKQESTDVFLLRFGTDGSAITDFADDGDRMFFRLEKGDSFEMWALGYACAFLTKLYLATGDDAFIHAAEGYLDWTGAYMPEALNTIPSVKIGWGAAAFYAVTGKAKAREMAETVLDYLVETQLADGHWYFSELFRRPLDQPFEIGADLSGEMVLRVCDIQRELVRGGLRVNQS